MISAILMPQADIDYYLHLYSINRLSDGGVIKIPFRLSDVDFKYEKDDVSISSSFSLEYMPKYSDFYLENESPQDIYIDVRELYMTLYFENSELSIGKQIHTWGSVDQNSPLDNASPYDYYYIFSMGTEQKMGSFSGAYNYYLGNTALGFVFSPIHHTNRLPLGNNDFPITLPITPYKDLIMPVDNEFEYGAYAKHSFDRADIAFSYYRGNDRVFNLSGTNLWQSSNPVNNEVQVDTVLTYRSTEVFGFSSSIVVDEVTLRLDFGHFQTEDPNNIDSIVRERPDKQYNSDPLTQGQWHELWEGNSHAFEERAVYQQIALQAEFDIFDISSMIGFFQYDIKSYEGNFLEELVIGDDTYSIEPLDYFYPGYGAPLAILTKEALMYQFQKELNPKLKLNLKGVNDLDNAGYLCELGTILSVSDDMKIHMYLNNIIGDDSQDEDYRFNQMEDFSHFRLELEYFF